MKSPIGSTLVCCLAALGLSEAAAPDFHQLQLDDPQNWSAGPRLFPANVIAGYNADYDKYNSQTWSDHVLAQCEGFEQCTSSYSCSAINSGTPKVRVWFGYCFRGGATTSDDYERGDGVEDSVVFTI